MKARIFFVASETFKNYLISRTIFVMVTVRGVVTEHKSCCSLSASIKAHRNHTKTTQKPHASKSINHQPMKVRIFFVASETFKDYLLLFFQTANRASKKLKINNHPIFESIALIDFSTRAIVWIWGKNVLHLLVCRLIIFVMELIRAIVTEHTSYWIHVIVSKRTPRWSHLA